MTNGLARPCIFVLLILCVAALQTSAQRVILRGTILTPDQVLEDGIITVDGERIAAVEAYSPGLPTASDSRGILDTHGLILPGMVDLHDHITWNMLPRWRANRQFANRYEWQLDTAYKIALDTPHRKLMEEGFGCKANFFGEVKAIINGATSVVGSLGSTHPGDNACIVGNARNLDYYSGFYGVGLEREKLQNDVFPLEMPLAESEKIRSELISGKLTTFVVHLAEGKPTDAGSAREFKMLTSRGFVTAGVIIDHGLALDKNQFRMMASKNMGIVWSPRSNIELYGVTSDIGTAKQEGLRIAIAPDWSPTGSDGMLEELTYAATWNSAQNFPHIQ